MTAAPILIVSYSGVLGGAERVLLDCASRLGPPVVVACPDGPLAVAVRAAGLDHEALPERPLRLRGARLAHTRALAALARDVAALNRRRRPGALVAWGARAILATSVLPRRPRLLAVHHDLPPSPAIAAALRWATRRADGAAAASAAIANEVAPRRRTTTAAHDIVAILHPGVDLTAFTPAPLPPADPPRALVLGALVPWKRPDLALEVAARVPGLRLEIAGAAIPGDGDRLVRALEARAARPDVDGRVKLLGALDDPRPALARAHCLLHCADAEPYGLALVEALAAGRPVVAPDAAGPREIVADGAGQLYPPGDPAAAAAALRYVLRDAGAPAAARARAEAHFAVEASAARLAAALEALARTTHRDPRSASRDGERGSA